jgi:periplasmic divalent cation tolerance protein
MKSLRLKRLAIHDKMNNMYTVVLVTASDKQEAEKIAQGLLSQRLAACVNMIEGITSVFRWQGKIDRATEVLLIIKTRKPLVKKVISQVKLLHSYEVPEIIALPIVAGSREYLEWIDESSR